MAATDTISNTQIGPDTTTGLPTDDISSDGQALQNTNTTPPSTSPTSILGDGEVGPLSKPTSVVSGATAANVANQAQTDLSTAKTQITTKAATPPSSYDTMTGFVTPYGLSQGATATQPNDPNYVKPPASSSAGSSSTSTDPTSQATTDVANTIAHPGQSQYYNTQNGNQEWVTTPTDGSTPKGYSTTDPQKSPVVSSITDPNGVTYNQYADGHYGLIDNSGNYAAASAGTFATVQQNSQAVAQAKQALANLNNGILTPAQQAQVTSLNQTYQNAISKLQFGVVNDQSGENAALGLGIQQAGPGSLSQLVVNGTNDIQDAQNNQADALAKLEAGFQRDDTDAINQAYSDFKDSSNAITSAVTKTQDDIKNQAEKQVQDQATVNDAMAKKYGDTTAVITPNMTADQLQAALQTSPRFNQDQQVAKSLNSDETKFWADMATSGVSMSTILPNLGIGTAAASLKVQIMQSIADSADKLGLSAQDVADSIQDRRAKAATYTQLQEQGGQIAAQESKVESDFSLVKQAGAKVPANVLQTGIPLLQDWIYTGTLASSGNAALNNYLGLLTTTLTNYARVVAGQRTGGSTTAAMNTEVQGLLDKGLSISAIDDYIDNAAIPEMKNTIGGYNTTVNSLMSDMSQADGTINPSQDGIGTDDSTGNTSTPNGTDSSGSFSGGGWN